MPETIALTTEEQPTNEQRGRLGDLYERHAGAGLRLAYLLTGDRHQAEDLLHDAFLRCVARFTYLRMPDTFDAYLRRAIVNAHTSGLRRKRVERAWLAAEGSRASRDDTSGVALPDVAGQADLWRRMQSLPARQRAALVLRYYEDLSERDTAQILGCSVAAVKSLVARGGETLRTSIESEES
jgi:RNA polymerase sigma-70 factor (sigma-E family)